MKNEDTAGDETLKELAKETEFLSREVQRLASIVRTLVEGMVYNHTRKYVFVRMLMNHDAVVDEYGKKTAMPETTDALLKKLRSENLDLMTEISNLLPYLKCERCGKQLLDRWDIAYSGLNDMVFCKDCYQKYLEELDRHPDG